VPTGGVGKSGGGGGKDDLVALLIVVAVLATVGMVATEGTRYDGSVAMYPWQLVHLKNAQGQEREVPLAQLSLSDAQSATKAVVMDDEGWGLMRLGRRPLDRKGFAFKLDLGGSHAWNWGGEGNGFGMNLQLGYFPHHIVGILGSWSFLHGSDFNGNTVSRNTLAIEAQVFPVSVWRLHLGAFGHAGVAFVNDAGGSRNGNSFGGGLILELALTSRLALTFRADNSIAQVGSEAGWAVDSTFTGGVAIY
jgi:hypothetical protein